MLIAMHAPDGFLEPPVAVVTAVISVAFIVVALRRASSELDDRQVPLAGMSAAFILLGICGGVGGMFQSVTSPSNRTLPLTSTLMWLMPGVLVHSRDAW